MYGLAIKELIKMNKKNFFGTLFYLLEINSQKVKI